MKNKRIGSTGASCHTTNKADDMFDVKVINETIHESSGTMKATNFEKEEGAN